MPPVGSRCRWLCRGDLPVASVQRLCIKPVLLAVASTDAANLMSQSIPALVLGFGGVTEGFHALDEELESNQRP